MTSKRYILKLEEISGSDIPLVGGKAAKLGEMSKKGFRIPDAFVITTEAYSTTLTQGSLQSEISDALSTIDYDSLDSIKAASDSITTAIQSLTIDDGILHEVKASYQGVGQSRVAVRSSATAEDMAEASFAGQYETYLNIQGESSLLKKVKNCYSSLWTPRAISYRQSKGIPHEAVRIAVLVQRMVDAEKAGVLFSDDPTGTQRIQMVIESNYGLGESVVSGVASPDRYIVSRKNHPEYKDFKVLSSEIGTKDVIIQSDETGSGVLNRPVSSEMSQSSSLSEDEVIELAKIGTSLEELFQSPQDVEWAIDKDGEIHVLQSRPITVQRDTNADEIFWTRGYSDDYWNDNVTPLFFDLLGKQLKYIVNAEHNDIVGYKDMPTDLLKLYKAHAYFNLDVLRTKVVNEMPPFVRSDDVLNYFPEGHGPYGKETMRNLPFALTNRIKAELRVTMYDSKGGMGATDKEYRRWTKEEFIPYLEKFDNQFDSLKGKDDLEGLRDLASEIDRVMVSHYRLIRYGIPVHYIGMNLISGYLLRRFLGEKAAAKLYPLLVTGLEHKTNETNKRLTALAAIAKKSPIVRDLIIKTSSDKVYSIMKLNPDASEFLLKFDTFMQEFGVRGFTREPYYPRWGEQPSLVFDILKPLVSSSGTGSKDIDRRAKRMRLRAQSIVEERIKSIRFGKIKWMLFKAIFGLATTYTMFREDQRFNLDRWITRIRALYLEVGKILTNRGIIENPQQVFFFYRHEIKKITESMYSPEALSDLSNEILERESEFKENEDVTPPKFIQGSRMYDDKMDYEADDSVVSGLAASQGLVTGSVRVLKKIEDIPSVQEGEILVVPRTDPGWTPVFAHIGGLITETGGVLSHGAVVSREYCIPAVTNIRQACQLLKTGQTVTLDGNNGTVTIHDIEA
ncbi:MAG: PEP/pyruvate-binding domain-containing protein [Candidatus Thorarchaeota archaeon]|jgi:pyruvate,water dikinase